MNLLIISASQRNNSQSNKVARYMAETATEFTQINQVDLINLTIGLWDGDEASKELATSDWKALEALTQASDALILITPEWSGTASPLLKNFLMMCEVEQTGHKPVLLVSVVDGINGAYPIAELRMNSFKNNKLVAIPDHLIIRNVNEHLNDTTPTTAGLNDREDRIRHRIAYSLHTLKHYAHSLRLLRENLAKHPFANEQKYLYGM